MPEGVQFKIELVDDGGPLQRPSPAQVPSSRPELSPATGLGGPGGRPDPSGIAVGPGGRPSPFPPGQVPSAREAAAGLPATSAIQAAAELGRKTGALFEKLGEGARTAAAGLSSLAANDHLGALKVAAGSTAAALEKIPTVGPLVAGAVRGFTAGIESMSSVVESFVRRGRELSGLNAQLAASSARADIRNLMSDFNEAQALGPGLSRLQDSWGELLAFLREVLLPLKVAVVDGLAAIVETLNATARNADIVYKQQEAWYQAMTEAAKALLSFDFQAYKKAQEEFQKKAIELQKEINDREAERKAREDALKINDVLGLLGAELRIPRAADPILAGEAAAAVPIAGPGGFGGAFPRAPF